MKRARLPYDVNKKLLLSVRITMIQNDGSIIIPLEEDSPARADARRNRELLLQTAQTLFNTHGVDAVSMTAIADAARVGKGTLYRHFENKADLCNALLDEDMRTLQSRTLRHMREHEDTVQKLRWFLGEVLAFVRRNEPLLIVEINGRGLELDHRAHYWWRQTIAGLLSQLLGGQDVRYQTDIFYVMLDVRTLRFQREVLGYSDDFILEGMYATLDRLIA